MHTLSLCPHAQSLCPHAQSLCPHAQLVATRSAGGHTLSWCPSTIAHQYSNIPSNPRTHVDCGGGLNICQLVCTTTRATAGQHGNPRTNPLELGSRPPSAATQRNRPRVPVYTARQKAPRRATPHASPPVARQRQVEMKLCPRRAHGAAGHY